MGGANNQKDLTNMQFGNLTVLSYKYTNTHGKYYLCKCNCGNTKIIRGSTLTSGKIQGCGCNIGKNNKGKTFTDKIQSHIGEKYNNLTIIDFEKNKRKNQRGYSCICKCNCGNITIQQYADVVNSKVISCGCLGKEIQSIIGSSIGLNNYKRHYDWYFIKESIKMRCRSGYEVIFANYLIQNNVNFVYEPKLFKLDDGERYIPDFYLKNENKWIEIKGSFDTNSQQKQYNKIAKFKQSHDIDVLFWDDIVAYCKLSHKSYQTYIRQAKKSDVSVEEYFANMRYV